jgi:sigma-B regulation protein RsbU (phosphoserine phosphatase)
MDKVEKLRKKLDVNQQKLKILLSIAELINKKVSAAEILAKFKAFLSNELEVERFLLAEKVNANQWDFVVNLGLKNQDNFSIDHLEKFCATPNFYALSDQEKNTFEQLDIALPISGSNGNIIGLLLLGDKPSNQEDISPLIKHLPFLQTLANLILVAIENLKAEALKVKEAQQEAELKLAAKIQQKLMPPQKVSKTFFEAAVFYQSFGLVGGDYCDIINLPNNNTLFVVADVSGKGIAASLGMASFRAHLRAKCNQHTNDFSLSNLANYLNEMVIEDTDYQLFITAVLVWFNPKNKALSIANLGHNPAIFFSKQQGLVKINSSTTAPGMLPFLQNLHIFKLTVEPNDALLLFTDGLTEVASSSAETANDFFGDDGIERCIHKTQFSKPEELNANLISALKKHQPDTSFYKDDISLMSIVFK